MAILQDSTKLCIEPEIMKNKSLNDIRMHNLKSWPEFFNKILSEEKTHELRRNTDRNFKVGDIILLNEYLPDQDTYTGRTAKIKITYITSSELPCAVSKGALQDEFCILSIKLLSDAEH